MEDMMKGPSETARSHNSLELANAIAVTEKQGTHGDEVDMDRMGKLQVLRRQFRFLTIFGFGVVLGSTWEYALMYVANPMIGEYQKDTDMYSSGIGISLFNGGPAGGIWMLVVVCCGMFCVTLSFGEMVSMMPTAGGQYHWVSELAPKSKQRLVSYVVGWLIVTAWQVGTAGTAYAVTQQIQGLIALNNPSYVIKGWHGTLMAISIIVLSIVWNTLLIKKLPLMEGVALVLHVFGFFAFIVVLWVMGPRSDVKDTFTKFEDPSGWGNRGLAILVGLLGPILTIGGSDLAVHLAEEVKDAAYTSPRAMVATSLVNYVLGFTMTVTIFCTLGSDLDSILNTPLGQPWIQILMNATGSKVATNIMTVAVCIMLLFCCINQLTAASRQLWSFARDDGLPCSGWLAHVPEGWDIPVNSVIFTFASSSLICLIIIGSPIAFNIIIALGGLSGCISDIICISCMLRKRLLGEPLLPSRFDLGKCGIVINACAILYTMLALVFLAFPEIPNPSVVEMNWSPVMFGCMVVFSSVYYFLYGRSKYNGPVEYVKKSL